MNFPRTVAQGNAFCNREEERKRLKYNIENTQHTLVISPRRYGKTSLILKSMEELGLPFAHIDLFLAFEEDKIVERFLAGIAKLVSEIVPINIKAIGKIRDYFKSFTFSLTTGETTLGLKLESSHQTYPGTIRNALEGLENFLIKRKRKAVVFVDEMQDIVKSPLCADFEAILRFYAQKTKHIAFIFSGSNRKLLKEIFDDRSRPLFKLCDRLNLQRIDEHSLRQFISKASIEKWHKKISDESLDEILNLTELHSYYVNYLCSNLWRLNSLPSLQQVTETWNRMCDEEAASIAMDIDSLTVKQKLLIDYIARKGTLKNITAQAHQQQVQISSRGLVQSIKGLLEKDILEKTPLGIRIVDPMLKTILLR